MNASTDRQSTPTEGATQPTGRPSNGDALHGTYALESLRRARRGAISYCIAGGAILLTTALLDHVRFPERATWLGLIRLAGTAALACVVGILHTPWGRRYPRLFALLAPATGAGVLLTLASLTGKDASPVIVSMNFVMLGTAVLIPWPAPWTAVACLLAIAEYVAAELGIGRNAFGPVFLDNLGAFLATSGIAVGMTIALERRRAREFAHEWALAAAHRGAGASAARYRSVVETAGSVIIVLADDGRITEFNREAERVLGWQRQDAIGRPFLTSFIPEPERASVAATIGRALAGGAVHEFEARMSTRDGGGRVLVCNASRLLADGRHPDGVIVSGQDITDRKRVEEALRESENRLRTVVANAPVVLFRVDLAGTITFSEGRGLARLGLSPGAVIGRRVPEVMIGLGMDPAPYEHYLAQALAGEEPMWVGSAAGATFESRLTPIRDAAGRVIGLIGVALDVTERVEAEEGRLALERKLLEAQKLESLGLLAGGVAHDFNNLLATVAGNASLALDMVPGESPLAPLLRRVQTAARRGSDLTRQMLAYAGRGSIMREHVDLNGIVDEMKDLLQVSMGRRVAVDYELAEDLPAIQADPTQVRQVVMNLVLNASDGIGVGEGRIEVRTGVAHVSEADLEGTQHGPDAAPGPHVYLEVADSGCGMDAATLARIFDPFFSTKVAGRGLGLATVLGAVRGHRGTLHVTSEPGGGTTFRIFFPCPEAAETAERADEAAANGPEGRTVLLVDDEEDVREVTAHMLEHLGCSVLVAGDGREGVEMFRAHAKTIDAVILDLTLPRLSGEHAFREIRHIRPDARVILMSGYNEQMATGRLTEPGLAGFLRKPFSAAELRSTVDRALTPDEPAVG
jgi:two-component system, cell cycle sensor histidine kinase and response regulator CckA